MLGISGEVLGCLMLVYVLLINIGAPCEVDLGASLEGGDMACNLRVVGLGIHWIGLDTARRWLDIS